MQNKCYKILLVEDNRFVSTIIKDQLELEGYLVYQVFDGNHAYRKAMFHEPDLVVLDIELPNMDGFDVFKKLRTFFAGPIVFLTSKDNEAAEVRSLQLGATDFVSKSKSIDILKLKIANIFKKAKNSQTNHSLYVGLLNINKQNNTCRFDQAALSVSNDMLELLYFFLLNPDEILSRDEISLAIKGVLYDGNSRMVDVSVSRLKKVLTELNVPEGGIKSFRGKGYSLISTLLE
ncbi:response regulator transcription factor [Psychromonas sp. Urea-02u-13]|uniref:response regulator transcription factor n=1 Tax=Psychromonas sp. Urea-02u-13 TaxID=2058326 RepID=UPI000C33341B|nr:response regulator transcription factor [Psychromonas sp. Urea-02u-13]PKG37389.1 hypothetical protein CXF74_19085 [Psychromonas sp. Urea-02u-13]